MQPGCGKGVTAIVTVGIGTNFDDIRYESFVLTMGNVATDSIRAEEGQRDRDDLKSSGSERPVGRELCRGEKVSVFGDHQQPRDWPEQKHRRAQLFLTFDDADGEITWRRRSGNEVTESLRAHQYCFIPPACPYALKWKSAADVVRFRLGHSLLAEHVAGPLQGVVVEDFKPLARLDSCVWSLAETLWETCRRPFDPVASFVEGIGIALASRVLDWQFRPQDDPAALAQALPRSVLKRLLSYVESHLAVGITVEELAKQAGLCVDHFARLFKNATGASPSQFIIKCRVEKALELLRTGEFRVADAAYEVGFCDQSHFQRQCRQLFGLTPKAVLQSAQSTNSSKKNSDSSKIETG
jgi:AraC family transcriptional regulator